ncbi:MAG: hypothetical protein ACE5E7_15855 [Anaerolineae bacterium]
MANESAPGSEQELEELRNRLEWLDSERRKWSRKLTELEQRMQLQDRNVDSREQRLQALERQFSAVGSQLSRLPQLDTQLDQFKDEIILMIEQYDQRRVKSQEEMDRLRRLEHEVTLREFASLRKELEKIGQLQRDLELQQAEDQRLARVLGAQKNQISELDNQGEAIQSSLAFMEEKEKQNARNLAELQNMLVELNKRQQLTNERLDALNADISRAQSQLRSLLEEQEEFRKTLKSWLEEVQSGEYKRSHQMDQWQRVFDEYEETMRSFKKQWVSFSDKYQEAKMAIDTLSGWQEQLAQQQRESSELLRVELHRFQTRWDDFRQDSEKKWKTFQVEFDQRVATIDRRHKQLQEQMMNLDELTNKLQMDKDMLLRIQSAQADAIKSLPRLWLEEVEKAVNQNPNRRRQPDLVPVREE